MEDYQERVLVERDQLKEKHDKLLSFMLTDTYRNLMDPEKGILYDQSQAMSWYLHTLNQRLDFWGVNNNG